MNLTDHDRKLLWAKSGNQCSYRFANETCNELLALNNEGKWTITGEECHIVGEQKGGPRYRDDFPERETYSNAILMCRKHHKLVDDNQETYTVELLHEMKNAHEEAISLATQPGEISPLVLKDMEFLTVVGEAQRAIGIEINRPAQLSNIKSELRVGKAQEAIGFSTNCALTGAIVYCKECNRPIPVSYTGNAAPERVRCPKCGHEQPFRSR